MGSREDIIASLSLLSLSENSFGFCETCPMRMQQIGRDVLEALSKWDSYCKSCSLKILANSAVLARPEVRYGGLLKSWPGAASGE